jgi:hypothetical protein
MLKPVVVLAAVLAAAPVAFSAPSPTIGTKLAGRVATLTGDHFPVHGCPKAVVLRWKRASDATVTTHALGTARLSRPQGTFTFVWHVPAAVHGALYVYVDDNCVAKGLQQTYETYYSFTAP